jgi:hypothetical protein
MDYRAPKNEILAFSAQMLLNIYSHPKPQRSQKKVIFIKQFNKILASWRESIWLPRLRLIRLKIIIHLKW